MAKQLSKSGITTGDAIEPWHVSQSIDALSGEEAYNLKISGSLQLTGSINMPVGSVVEGTASYSSYALTASYALNGGGGGGGGNPGGDNNSIQYKNGTNFNGQSDFLYIPSSKTLEVTTGSINHISSSFIGASTISASTIQAGTFVGNISADEIRTPALIGGVASTLENASSSITPLGYARFVSASIGGWDITPNSIESNSMIMRPEGLLQTKNFASSQTGWRISAEGNGTAEFENARIRGTLSTTTFEKETVNAVGGQLWVVNSTTITGSNVTSVATTMSVANASGFSQGEILLAKKVDNTGFSTEYILINSSSIDGDNSGASETYGRIMVTRGYGQGTSGDFVGDLASAPQAYSEGQVLVSTGKIGTGFIKLNANPNDLETPYIDITERTGSGIFDVQLKARLGDLSGLANSDYVFNRPNPGFGLATDNVFLQGGIKATFGEIGGFGISATTISSSNNDLILRSSGEMTASGGFLFGNKAAAQYVQYDGANLVVRGDLSVDNIKTPAIINSSPSTFTNASSSIDSQGFARFNSASIAGFTVNTSEIKSSDDSLRLKANGNITASNVLLGDKSGGNFLQFDGSTLTVQGSITADQISTPSNLSGANVSSSISPDGFASFKSASIGGFEITPDMIRSGVTPASSSVTNTNVRLSSFSLTSAANNATPTISNQSYAGNPTNGFVFSGYIRRTTGGQQTDFNTGLEEPNDTSRQIAASYTVGSGNLTINSPGSTGLTFGAGTTLNNFSFYTDSSLSSQTFVSSSTTNFPATEAIILDSANNRISIIDGTITGSNVLFTGGEIGGTVINGTSLESTNDISPAPTSGVGGKAFKLENSGTISGSNMYIRQTLSLDGSTTVVYPLIDTRIGLLDGRNLGRQIASDYTLYTRQNVDDGTTFTTIGEHFFQLLPYENSIVINCNTKTNAQSGTQAAGQLSFQCFVGAETGSYENNTYWDVYNAMSPPNGAIVSNAVNTTNANRTKTIFSTGADALTIDIPEAYQARAFKLLVKFKMDRAISRGQCSFQVKGYTATATRALTAATSGNPEASIPEATI